MGPVGAAGVGRGRGRGGGRGGALEATQAGLALQEAGLGREGGLVSSSCLRRRMVGWAEGGGRGGYI